MDTIIRIFRDIGINESLFVMFPLIIIAFFLLKYQLFLPLRNVLDQRAKIHGDADAEAQEKNALVAQKSAKLEERLREARNEAVGLREKMKTEAENRRQALLAQARQNTAEQLERLEAELIPTVRQAKDSLQSDVSSLAALIADKVMSSPAEPKGKAR